MKKLFFLASAFAIFCANADDWFVANTGSDDNNDGKDWDHCFATIKKGIASASNGDTVWVEDGYVSGSDIAPASGTSLIEVNKAITLRSASGYVDEANVKGATIRGYQPDGLVTNAASQLSTARRGVQLVAGASLVGFVVEKGASPNYNRGGGVYGAGTSSVVSNCVVRDNVGCYGGGGLYNVAVYKSLITNNLSCRCGGGGFQCDFYNCDIIGNTDVSTSINDGGGGGAVDANVYNCRLIGNVAKTSYGGALRGYQKSGLVCRDSTICGNKAPSGGGFYSSSGTYVYTVSGCTICSNSAQAANNIVCSKSRVFGHYSGGAVLGDGTYTGCIIEDNHATNCASGGLGLGIVYSNCVIRGNSMNYTGQCYGFLTTNGKVIGCMVSNNVMTINGVQSGNRWGLLTYSGTVIGSIATNNFSGYLVGGTTSGSKIYNSLLYHADTVVRQSDCWNSTMIRTTTGYTTDRLAVCTNCVCWNLVGKVPGDLSSAGVFNSCTSEKSKDPTGRSFSTDPMLDADARPLKNSPCRDACTGDAAFAWMTDVSDARSLDAFGKKRVVGTYADIGALEYLVHKGSAILIH